ncbi:PIG-P-domain-containing protein [Cryomyces antarcticus]
MAPQSRGGAVPTGPHSQSTPNLPSLRSLQSIDSSTTAAATTSAEKPHSPTTLTYPSEPTSLEHFSLDNDGPPRALPSSITTASSSASDSGSSSSSSSSSSADRVPNLPARPFYHHHSRSHTYLGAPAFAPPFYNRPPTPLPPSPSLTSLLRPSTFSAHTSRPTTPDPSSDEGTTSHPTTNGTGTHTPTSSRTLTTITSAARTAPILPRASPKVPTYEYYGFALYLSSTAAFAMYLLWSYLPSPFLHQLGIHYYPNRWWSLAIPAWLVVAIVYIYVALAAYNTSYLTLPMSSIENLVDEAAQVAVVDAEGRIVRQGRSGAGKGAGPGTGTGEGRRPRAAHSRNNSAKGFAGAGAQAELDWRALWNEGTDAVMDVPIGGVCEVLYGAGREGDRHGKAMGGSGKTAAAAVA